MPIELNSRFSYRVVFLTANCVRVEIYSRQGDNLGHFPWMHETVMWVMNCWIAELLNCWIAELHYQEIRRPVVGVLANNSQDADTAIIMHSACKNNSKYHRGSLWHDKRRSVTEWGWSCAAAGTKHQTRLSSSAKTIISARTRLATTCDTSCQLKYRTSISPSATIANRYISKQLTSLTPAPVLDYNQRRKFHIGTRSYMDRHHQACAVVEKLLKSETLRPKHEV